jgi:hypothetical protein
VIGRIIRSNQRREGEIPPAISQERKKDHVVQPEFAYFSRPCALRIEGREQEELMRSGGDSPPAILFRCSMTLEERLEKIEALLASLVEREKVREWYSVEECARILGRSSFTVREWARHGRIIASKKNSGRGAHAAWVISHAELSRYQRDGLLRRR